LKHSIVKASSAAALYPSFSLHTPYADHWRPISPPPSPAPTTVGSGDFCRQAGGRLLGVAVVPLHDPRWPNESCVVSWPPTAVRAAMTA
jgi:hypothetical protein